MIRAVLDTNVVVSSLLQPAGIPHRIVQAWKADRFELCLSRALFEEIEEVLKRPVILKLTRVTTNDVRELLELLPELALFAAEPLSIKLVIADDPDDDVVLATALATGADVIVSGDHHLQELQEYEGIPIVSPRIFLEKFCSP